MDVQLPYKASIQQVNREIEPQPEVLSCCTCETKLGSIIYSLYVPKSEIDGVYYWSYEAEFCSEEHARQWLETDYPTQREAVIVDGIPTQETRDIWIHALRQVKGYPEASDHSGKWLIWLTAQNIDRYWQIIREAVIQGRLGGEAKVSTGASSKAKQGHAYVICVYTYDYNDEADVMRVRAVLRGLGIRREIIYKADEDTYNLRYGSGFTPKYRS